MSLYTTEVRFICETEAGLDESVGFNDIDEVLSETTINKVINFDFPIFDELYRIPLLKKILMHYYTREISEETVGLWKLRLRTKLNEIMPYYNQLYKSETLEFNPLYNVEYSRTHNLQKVGSVENKNNGSYTNVGADSYESHTDIDNDDTQKDLYSETPQGAITNLENETYLTNARKVILNNDDSTDTDGKSNSVNTGSNEGEFVSNISNVDNYVEYVAGRMGENGNKLLREYRENMLNIDMLVIEELSGLFFGLWG